MRLITRTTWRKRAATAALFGVPLLFAFLVLASPAFAQQDALQQVGQGAGLASEPLPILIARLIRVVIGVLGLVLVVLIVYAGFLYMTAKGEESTVEKAKTIIKNAVIGLVIVLASFAITTFILNALLRAAGFGGISSTEDQFSEPLSGALGAGIIQDHYPPRNAVDIPRNGKIFVTFKEPIAPGSVISGFHADVTAANPQSTLLNTDSVKIYYKVGPSDDSNETIDTTTGTIPVQMLESDQVAVYMDESAKTFVFDPAPLLGDGVSPRSYFVRLTDNVQRGNGTAAFTGASSGYEWSFEVGTQVDLTPPQVVSTLPAVTDSGPFPPNITVSITFNEAMDPVASTGTYDPQNDAAGNPTFANIDVLDDGGLNVPGTFAISNGYRTVDFTTTFACGTDPCGGTIFCLPMQQSRIRTLAHAAKLGTEPPQALLIGASYNGLTDASGNSLDGNGDGTAQGNDADDVPGTDDYNPPWEFGTTDAVCADAPTITALAPGREGLVDIDRDVEITFNMPMKSSTLTNSNVQLWPDPWYEFWFVPHVEEAVAPVTFCNLPEPMLPSIALLDHPTLIPQSTEKPGGYDYLPLVSNDVRSAFQICMFPSFGPECANLSATTPYCCDGSASSDACGTSCSAASPDPGLNCPSGGIFLPDTSE